MITFGSGVSAPSRVLKTLVAGWLKKYRIRESAFQPLEPFERLERFELFHQAASGTSQE
jgi:hypothetical protein